MVLVTQSKRVWFAGMAVSLLIFAVLYFTVIQPSTNNANALVKQGQQAISTSIKQSQQAIKQAQQQAGGASGSAAATGQVNQTVNKAAKLATCVASAGTDPSKIQACQVKYAG